VARFQRLVNDLLGLARGDRPAERAPVDVTELAQQVCRERDVADRIVESDPNGADPADNGSIGNGSIGNGSIGNGPVVWQVDRRRLGQLLGNLLENAEAYGGGATAVRLGLDGDLGWLEVDDEGPGVSPDDKPVIFDRFVRGRSAGSRSDGAGAGLGLALVAQHAAAHGGTVAVLDRPGGGARFRVELPGCAP
jgi:two-component system sensor histidine kinase MtrB